VDGHHDRHLKRLGQRTEAASARVQMSLFKGGHRIYAESVGGYYIYLLLPDDVNDIELARDGANESIFIAPGSVFASTKQPVG
jgi:DNA-binding transcriptional MocR family regulator